MALRTLLDIMPDRGKCLKAPWHKAKNRLHDFMADIQFSIFSSPEKPASGFLSGLFRRKMKPMVFGLGTGRCGTVTLADLLNAQKGFTASHETHRSPWIFDMMHLKHTIVKMQASKGRVVCDVSSWHLPYVDKILALDKRTKFVCLQREKAATVESFLKKTAGRNHWTSGNSDGTDGKWRPDARLDRCFPKYNLGKSEAIARYWDEYYDLARRYVEIYPDNFALWEMADVLNSEEGQKKMLRFLNIAETDMVFVTNRKLNRSMD